MVRLLAILPILLCSLPIRAQEIRFLVEANKKTITLGNTITLTYKFIGGNATDFRPPKLVDIDYASYVTQGMEVRQFNNNVTRAVTFSFSIKPRKTGEFEIPPATVMYQGNRMESDKITIKVLDKSEAEKGIYEQIAENVFVKAYLSKNNVYLGEQVKLTFKLFKKVNMPIAELNYKSVPEYDGFWKEVLQDNRNFEMKEELIDGERFQTGILESVILFPQKTGEVVIDPYVMHAKIPYQTKRRGYPSIFDDFFGQVKYYDYDLSAPAIKIDVKPLPPGKPHDFSGLVGEFTFNAALTDTQVEIDDAVTLNIEVAGQGNLKLIKPWELEFPSGIEDYPTKTHDNISTSSGLMSGSRRFEYLMFPRREGIFKLPAIRFSYFDVEQEKYVSFSENDLSFKVGKGTNVNTVESVGGQHATIQNDVDFINNDIQFIKFNNINLFPMGYSAFLSAPHIAFTLAPFGLLFLLVFVRKKKEEEAKDVVGTKMKRATSLAKKRLQTAGKLLDEGNEDAFYNEVSRAVFGFLSHKFAIKESEMSKAFALKKLQEAGLPQELIDKCEKLIDDCEFARFAPGPKGGVARNIYQNAVEVISNIENKLARQ
ncbi:hypothetical protein GC194_10600 [bacterium]|nr:hypothetical protein [bacterium]